MNKKILTLILAAAMTTTAFGTTLVVSPAQTATAAETENQAEDFKITENTINDSSYKTVFTDETLNFASTTTGGKGNVTYRYFISDGRMDARRTEIPAQGYKITEPGTYRINVRADDEQGHTAMTDYMITVNFKILDTKINNSNDKTVHTYTPLYFTSTSSSAVGNVTYRYFISDGRMDAQRTEIPQGYKITEPGTYRINVRGDDSKGNVSSTDFMINVVSNN